MASIDAKGFFGSELYTSAKDANSEAKAKFDEVLGELKEKCDLDIEKMESVVVGFDAISQGVMGAVRLPNLGKADALTCLNDVAKARGGKPLWTVAEADGKPTVSIEEGEVEGWAMDDDTLVLSTKGWSSAVQARMKGESKGAIDNNLAEAVALAERSKHVWMAGQVPAIMERFLAGSPVEGGVRGAASVHFSKDMELAAAVEFSEEAKAKALEATARPQIDMFKGLAVTQGFPQEAADSVKLEVDGAVVRGAANIPIAPLVEVTIAAFTKYINRSKTSEARVQLAKMVDSASAYFMEEHVTRDGLALPPHGCPNDGRLKGDAGITPPLSVKCSDGTSGKCVVGSDGYEAKQWENPVWEGLNFAMEEGHYFHYNFKWENSATGYGSCQFTAQAFGDLDGDGVFSTYERAGAADQNGVNMAAGLYIDQELE